MLPKRGHSIPIHVLKQPQEVAQEGGSIKAYKGPEELQELLASVLGLLKWPLPMAVWS